LDTKNEVIEEYHMFGQTTKMDSFKCDKCQHLNFSPVRVFVWALQASLQLHLSVIASLRLPLPRRSAVQVHYSRYIFTCRMFTGLVILKHNLQNR